MAENGANLRAPSPLADTYAEALFQLADEAGALDETEDELKQLVALLEAEPQLKAVFEHKTITATRRRETIDRIFRERLSNRGVRFLHVLNEHQRLDQLEPAQAAFDQKMKARRGEVDVEVHSPNALEGALFDRVQRGVSEAIGRTAILHPRVDASLIGGLKFRIGDRLVDASVATRLRRIREELTRRGRQSIRERIGSVLTE